MSRPLRSLSGLIDFECAARWDSFKLAAAELHKTPAAVSQQIKHLEEEIGFALFARHPRHITLTEKGRELSVSVSRVLAELRAKVSALQEGDEESVLRISTTHSFAIKWLTPRLMRFTRLHPELDIRIDSSDTLVNLDDDSVDVVIRYCRVEDGDPTLLFRERFVAVYSPALPAPGAAALTLADLRHCPLLYERSTQYWLRFLRENGVAIDKLDFSRSFTHWGVLAQAAVAGQGVGLVPFGIVYDDILRGGLRLLEARSMAHAKGYRFLVNPRKRAMPKVARFRAWLEAEMALMQQALEHGAGRAESAQAHSTPSLNGGVHGASGG